MIEHTWCPAGCCGAAEESAFEYERGHAAGRAQALEMERAVSRLQIHVSVINAKLDDALGPSTDIEMTAPRRIDALAKDRDAAIERAALVEARKWEDPPCWCPDVALAADCPKHCREEARRVVEEAIRTEHQLDLAIARAERAEAEVERLQHSV